MFYARGGRTRCWCRGPLAAAQMCHVRGKQNMNKHDNTIINHLEAMPFVEARKAIRQGTLHTIGSPNHAVAVSWLEGKEAERRDERDAKALSESKAETGRLSLKDAWKRIEKEYGESKKTFGKKINFIQDRFKRDIIFRDIGQAFVLAREGFSKPSVVLAGSVIEEMLRFYLQRKNITVAQNRLDSYIKACEEKGLLKAGIHRLADSVRQFRNIVHLEKEVSARHTISKATALAAFASIFTIANDFE